MSKITIWIPSMPQKSYAYRRGDCQVIHDDKKNCIIIDGGEDYLCDQAIRYCKNHGITNITYILSHWHYDHDRGMTVKEYETEADALKEFFRQAGQAVDTTHLTDSVTMLTKEGFELKHEVFLHDAPTPEPEEVTEE